MNIAYLTADFGVPVFGFKGASIHVREMVRALQSAGHSVRVYSPSIHDGKERGGERAGKKNTLEDSCPSDNRQPEFHSVLPNERHLQLFQDLEKLDKLLRLKTRIRQELRNLLYNLAMHEAVLASLRTWRPDFIYERYALFGVAGIRLARELDVPHLLEVNAPLAYEQEKMRGLEMKELARATEQQIYLETDQVMVVSRQLHETVAACGVPDERICVLPNAVDPSQFRSATGGRRVREQHGLATKRVVGFVGSLKPWHGTETLVEAFRALQARIDNVHLLIVGDGPAREALQQFAASAGLNGGVTFTGNVPYADVPDYIAAMDIAVAPYTPNEKFYYSPIKIFEYMVMGKPVVAGGIGQVKELINHGETGLLFEPGNVTQLSEMLATLANDPPLCRRLGDKAREWVKCERTWENNASQVVALASELISKRNPRSQINEAGGVDLLK
jgi:glycosyltransferase involved in cell wall biosynthesis